MSEDADGAGPGVAKAKDKDKASSADNFETLAFEKTLAGLKDTQVGIQALSSWCLKNRHHHKRIVNSWLNVLKRAKVEQRLTLFYLANDVIQYSKKKNYEFVESWGTTLQKATPLVRDEKVKHRILRIFRIWEERCVYDEEFLADLTGLLSATTGKSSLDVDPNDFQPAALIGRIKQCCVLEKDSETQANNVAKCQLSLDNLKTLGTLLKERDDADQATRDLENVIKVVELYVKTMEKELVAKEELNRLLSKALQHFTTQRGEVKVVANAYRQFGTRVKSVKRKLDDLCVSLPSLSNSPVPSPPLLDEAVPSPGPDEDLDLPNPQLNQQIDQTINMILSEENFNSNNKMDSFMGSSDFSYGDYGKTNDKKLLEPPPPPPPILPGLDLLASTNVSEPPPPIPPPPNNNFYGSNNSSNDVSKSGQPYTPNTSQNWNNSWNYSMNDSNVSTASIPEPPMMVPPPSMDPNPMYPDVDHRTLVAPPPPPQPLQMLLQSNDTDHRSLPPISQNQNNPGDRNRKDVDHRNLISLTGFSSASEKPTQSWTPSAPGHIDKDYRDFSPTVPPPNMPFRQPPSDNVESIDMEMSDEESHEIFDDYNNAHDSSPYKKPNFNNKFNNFNKGYGNDNHRDPNNMKKLDTEMAMRGNLVRINSDGSADSNPSPADPNLLYPHNVNPLPNTPTNDVFSDFNEAMNPFNPNLNQQMPTFNEKRGNDWDMPEDSSIYSEPESWRKQFNAINPPRPNYRNPGPPPFHNNSFSPRFRGPSFRPPRERGPMPDNNRNNFRRPWGPKPPRQNRNFW